MCSNLGASLVTVRVSTSGKTTQLWQRTKHPEDAIENVTHHATDQEKDANSKKLLWFCGTVMEEHDEAIEAAIMGGKFDDLGKPGPASRVRQVQGVGFGVGVWNSARVEGSTGIRQRNTIRQS